MNGTIARTIVTTTLIAAGFAVIAGCATGRPPPPTDETVVDFIEVNELESLDRIRTHNRDSWEWISDKYIVYKTRDSKYLFEFRRKCHELTDNRVITPDRRTDTHNLHARFDTMRGCIIDRIYSITDGQYAEIKALGEAPGQRN